MIVYAFHVAGGIQLSRQIDADTMSSEMVMPEDPGWAEALAAAKRFESGEPAPPIKTPEDMLQALREAASMSRTDFVLAVVRSGILPLSLEEAGQAARGEIPATFQQVIATMPEEEQFEAVVRWSGATVIERMNPVLLILAEAMQISDEQLDALFNIQPSLE